MRSSMRERERPQHPEVVAVLEVLGQLEKPQVETLGLKLPRRRRAIAVGQH